MFPSTAAYFDRFCIDTDGMENLARRLRGLAGHFWTVLPALREAVRVRPAACGAPFTAALEDSRMGAIKLTGILDEPAGADSLVLVVHGHGSDARSLLCAGMARAAASAGLASLRLSLRGADLSGDDIYHGGLTEDLRAALSSPRLARYRRVFVVGYSVGGNIALRAALDGIDSRIRGVASICAPLDLAAGATEFDKPCRRVYRNWVFANLNRVYAATALRKPLPTPVATVLQARSVRERDEMTVVPRFGFRSADDYYRRIQPSDELERMSVPALIVAAVNDPVVPIYTVMPSLRAASKAVTAMLLESGGHMAFPGNLPNQVIQWLIKNQ